MSKGTFQPVSDTHISYEDQQKINQFAKLNAKLRDLQEELSVKENDFKNLEEACEEIELMDEDEKIPYLVGEIFMYESLKKVQENLDNDKAESQGVINKIKEECSKVQDAMSELKVLLYGKFGSHINLEADD